VPQSPHARGASSPRHLRRALIAAVAVAVVAAVPATAGAAAPSAKRAHRLAPPKVHPPKKPKKTTRHKRRAPVARASLCSAPLVGDWRNINSSTNAMTRALVTFTCGDVIHCDLNGNCTGGDSYYSTQMFGKCSPTDCAWGRVRAYPQYDGWIRSMYYFGFITSHVWLKTYSYYGRTYLRVWVYNDFAASDGRTDYTTDEWFLR
jgi:hypothetical protein